ncbi:sulfurase [Primorskyibacter aestuariivivens]|uniref:MOSC domain-containing protein n=1 Tax=Primorskyibacter aestuariivivens TaxID=1888912 RepID=UPI002301C72F|nr:MOSC domain-containing protein [Primorskyibacter aestuariivivens]MDA7428426.1 sulfurase [Primorskyibacter aestuariivivens]
MPALIATLFYGEITWLGAVTNRGAGLRAQGRETVKTGFEGESHGGLTRRACARVSNLYPRGTEIRNVRQLSVLSEEELATTAAELGMERIDPTWVGASLVLSGIPDFTHVPPSSRLQGESGTVLTIDMENLPCSHTAREIEAEQAGAGTGYKAAARGRRGVTARVEREGVLRLGEKLRLLIPAQPSWSHAERARVAGR